MFSFIFPVLAITLDYWVLDNNGWWWWCGADIEAGQVRYWISLSDIGVPSHSTTAESYRYRQSITAISHTPQYCSAPAHIKKTTKVLCSWRWQTSPPRIQVKQDHHPWPTNPDTEPTSVQSGDTLHGDKPSEVMIENKVRFCSRIGDARTCLGSCLFCGTDVAVPGEFVIKLMVISWQSLSSGGSTTGMFSHLSVHHKEAYREAKESQHQPTPSYKPTKPPSGSPIDLSARLLSPYIPLYQYRELQGNTKAA